MSRAKKRRVNAMRRKQRRAREAAMFEVLTSPFMQTLVNRTVFEIVQRFSAERAAEAAARGTGLDDWLESNLPPSEK